MVNHHDTPGPPRSRHRRGGRLPFPLSRNARPTRPAVRAGRPFLNSSAENACPALPAIVTRRARLRRECRGPSYNHSRHVRGVTTPPATLPSAFELEQRAAHDVPLGVAREDAVRPHRRAAADLHVHTYCPAQDVVPEDAGGKGGMASQSHQHPSIMVAPQLATLKAADTETEHGTANFAVDPEAASQKGKGGVYVKALPEPYRERREGTSAGAIPASAMCPVGPDMQRSRRGWVWHYAEH